MIIHFYYKKKVSKNSFVFTFLFLVLPSSANILVKKTGIKMAKKKKESANRIDKKTLNNPHDRFFKTLFTMLAVVKEYFIHFFPKELSEKLDIETLEYDSTTYITTELETFYSDIVWQCQFKNSDTKAQICFIFEHKSYVPKFPNVQIGDYKQGAYNKQIKTEQPLQIVMPIIVYHGDKEWIVKPFLTYFGDIDPAFHVYIDDLTYHLTNLADYSDEMIKAFNTIFIGRAFLAYKHFKEKAYLQEHFVELVFSDYESKNFEENIGFIRPFSLYLYTISGGISVEEIMRQKEQLENRLNQNQNSQIMVDIIDQLQAEFEKKGIEKGKQMAIFEAWEKGYDIELLANVFSLSTIQVRTIVDEWKKIKK